MWSERSRYGEYHKVNIRHWAHFKFWIPRSEKIALFSQENQNSSNLENEGFDVPLFKSAQVSNFFL